MDIRTPPRGSRYVPAHVRREVRNRDGYRCAFVSGEGRRCTEESFLQRHHKLRPYARGGPNTVENLAQHCWRHNQYEAERTFGRFKRGS